MNKTLLPLGHTSAGRPIYPIRGSEGGYHAEGDLIRATLDNADLNTLWAEFQQTLDIVNGSRSALTNLLTFNTVQPAEEVLQSVGDDDFEIASEFGEPRGTRPRFESRLMGFDFNDFDKATRYTWKFLRDAAQAQVEQTHQMVLASDNKNVTTTILRRLLDPTPVITKEGRTAFGLYSGDDFVPPRWGFNEFSEPHSHYLTSGSDLPDGADIDDMARHIAEHGYTSVPGSQLLLFCHPDDLGPLTLARAGDEAGSQYDFIPSANAPAYLSSEEIIGDKAPAEWNRMKIAGSYGDVWISAHPFMPPRYLAMVASGGPNSTLNPIGFRQHPSLEWQGLRLLPGNQSRYPLVDSYYTRGFGVGVRHRGAAAVMQITESDDYTPPSRLA